MKAIRSHHLCRSTSLALALLMFGGLLAPGLGAWAAAPAQTILVFPVANAAENAPLDIGDRATGALTIALDDVPGMDAMQFSPIAPSVRRAISEGRIRQVDVDEGARDVPSVLSMAAALHADLVVLASVQSYTKKDAPPSVEVILAGQMYAVAPNINPVTGEAIAEPKVQKAFGVSGVTPARGKFSGNEAAMAQEALRDAAYKAAQTLAGRTDVASITSRHKKGSDAYKWVLLALLLGGLAVAVNSGGGGDTAPPPTAPPPTNPFITAFPTSLRVSWSAPSQTPAYYQVQRAVDGSAFSFFDGSSNVPNTETEKYDFNPLASPPSHIYQYRIRAVYGGSTFSVYVPTGAFEYPAP